MKILLLLIYKDFQRVWKKPWVILIFMAIPILFSWMMAMIFGSGREAPEIVLNVAVLDDDEDFFAGMIRSMSNQGDVGDNLKIHFVDHLEEGIDLIERRKVSALLVFPPHMTSDLLDGATATIEVYKNPAQTILPQIIEQGCEIITVSISMLLSFMGPEIKQTVELFDSETLPPSWGTAMVVYQGMQKLEAAKTYMFPPIIDIKTEDMKDYDLNADRGAEPPRTEEEIHAE
ncbi:MAG: ABC transporter permease [Candidatus Hinthialibacter sp.]